MPAKKITLLTLLLLALSVCAANAHRLNVFAWLDNDKIIVRCNFGKNSPAMDAQVNVYNNSTHTLLLEGHTDARGMFAFDVPEIIRQGHSVLITVDGGQGHHGEWLMEASEVYAAASLTAGFDEARLKKHSMENGNAPEKKANVSLPATGVAETDRIRSVVREELAPLHEQLAMLNNRGPGISEIVGGIGWILGLAGIGAYFMARRKRN